MDAWIFGISRDIRNSGNFNPGLDGHAMAVVVLVVLVFYSEEEIEKLKSLRILV